MAVQDDDRHLTCSAHFFRLDSGELGVPRHGATRDLRLDFMRGFVIPLLFASHFEYFSALMFIGWERIGVISTAEIFVILSGIVVGMVYGKKVKQAGVAAAMPGLISRSVALYRISVLMILTIAALRFIPWLDTTIITTFHDPYGGKTFQLYPPIDASIFQVISKALLLQIGPHQFQIVGMYVVMFILFTPLVFFMLAKRQLGLLLGASWVLYLINLGSKPFFRPTNAQFEYAFPILSWQLLYVHGMVAGYYKQEVVQFFSATAWGKRLVALCIALSLGFIVFTWNHPLQQFPEWARLHFVPADTFLHWYNTYFTKNTLGIGRLVNVVVLFIAIYTLMTLCWQPLNRMLGWFFIPLGQASLYVFFIHVFLLLLIANTPLPSYENFWINTGIHIGLLALVWVLVKRQFLFRWIPH
ncbi:OpgC domain-containing protein [Thiothrix subterranea]|uniref:OpgC domain-containing protein n=1 Tax=Thiothrix subterranea TaxID=2735563 RepID=UPI00280AE275|nr:OpgC domain-containing protein [Thiothrix subterranea]